MNNKTENKLVVTSGMDKGKEYSFFQARTTIGSAPDNDIQLNDPDISGFHAEISCQNDTDLIFDFNSAKGTFVNNKRITKEKVLAGGDKIRLGSTHAVFIPRNGVVAKGIETGMDWHNILKRVTANPKRWINKGNKKILACTLPVVVAVMMAMAVSGPSHSNQGRHDAQHEKAEHADQAGRSGSEQDRVLIEPVRNNAPGNGKGSLNHTPNGSGVATAGAISNSASLHSPAQFADIYFDIADTFADHQLWQIALEYYHKILEKIPEYPELSDRIQKMEAEIQHQLIYTQALNAIESEAYEKGIADLRKIPDNSYYYQNATQAIAEAEEKVAQPNAVSD